MTGTNQDVTEEVEGEVLTTEYEEDLEVIEVERPIFSEVFWTALILFSIVGIGVYLFTITYGANTYPEPAFLASMTVIGGLATAAGMSASAAIAAFALGERKIDMNTIYLFFLLAFVAVGMVSNLDLSQFKDAAVKGAATSIPGALIGVALLYMPTTSRVKKLIRLPRYSRGRRLVGR